MSKKSVKIENIHVYGAIISNFIIAVSKFIVASITGSSAMLSEGIHSTADTGNQFLMLLGIRESKKPPNDLHPFGRGKELYFWSLIVALILFGLGGGMSIYEGITHIQHPVELSDPIWNYLVLGIAFVVESVSQAIAYREFLHQKLEGESAWHSIRTCKDPTIFVVLFENGAALAGLFVAGLGVFLSHQYNAPVIDGVASIIIGIILAAISLFLAWESRALLIGESADLEKVDAIQKIVQEDKAVITAGRPLTMHFGPDQILLNISVNFDPNLSFPELTQAIQRIEGKIQGQFPRVRQIFLEATTLANPSGSD
jgi:cation diffusion facilitator family transporter